MGFVAPPFLLLLGLCVPVALLHARRQSVRTVGSLQIWKSIAATGSRAKANWRWPRPSVPLILHLATLSVLALALSQPFWMRNAAPEHWVVVIDASASMQATDVEPSRFEAATERLRSLLSVADSRAVPRFSLISAGHRTILHAARVENRDGVLGAYQPQLLPSAGAANWDEVAAAAASLIRTDEVSRILLFTDASTEGPARLSELSAGLDVFRFSTQTANAGLIAKLRKPDAGGDGKASAVLEGEVLLSGMENTRVTIEYTADGSPEPLLWRTLDIVAPASAGETAGTQRVPFSIPLDFARSGLVSVRLPDDAANFDNAVHFRVLAEPEPFPVLYLGPGNPPLLKALQATDGVAVFEADGLPQETDQFRLVIADNVALPREPENNVLFVGSGRLGTEPEASPFEAQGPSHWNFEHPLARGVDLGALQIGEAFHHEGSDGWSSLLQAEGEYLLLVRDTEFGRQLRIAFQPMASNWPELVDFPIFIRNLVHWLGPTPGSTLPMSCQVGEPCAVPAELRQSPIQSDGQSDLPASAATEAGAPAFIASQPGIYRIEAGSFDHLVPVNGVAASEIEDVSLPLPGESDTVADMGSWQGWAALLILALVLLVLELWWTTRRRASGVLAGAGRWTLAPRLLSMAFVALALFNVTLPYWTTARNLVVIGPVDLASIAGGAADGTSIGLVSVDVAPMIAADLGGDAAVASPVAPSAADVEASLLLAAAMLPPDQPGRIALMAPRRQTVGDISQAIEALRARSIAVDVITSTEPADEVALLNLQQAGRTYAADPIPLTALAFSDNARSATLKLSRGGEDVIEQAVALRAGHNRLQTVVPNAGANSEVLTLTLEHDDDFLANNSGTITTELDPSPRVLILTPQQQQGEMLAALLGARGIESTVQDPSRAPWRLEQYLDYDAVVLANVPAIDLDTRQQLLLEQSVAEHGRGLVIFGGENSFGPGGYLETPLDRISPLSSKVPRDAPEAALAFVLDRSGSMSQKVGNSTRLDIAKQATQAAIELLGEGSQVAVVVFDSEAQIGLPLQSTSDTIAIERAINSITAGGGTAIAPGLAEGLRQLQGVDAPARHIVLMTDGLSTPGDVEGVMEAIRAEGITVSAVAIGEGADATGLRRIADIGGGSFHATRDFQALPGILSQEAMLLSGSPIEEGAAQPQWTPAPAAGLQPMPGPLPSIYGFVLTTAKDAADLSLVVPDREGELMPLLASWRYGNGEVVALTTHAVGSWSQQALEGMVYPRIISQALRNVLASSRHEGLVVQLDQRRDEVTVLVQMFDPVGQTQDVMATATLTRPTEGGAPRAVGLTLDPVSPGVFRGQFVAADPGRYMVTVLADRQTKQAQLTVNYPDLTNPEPDSAPFLLLAEATGGRVISSLDELAQPDAGRWTSWPAMLLWTLVALVLFLADLGLRYLPWRRRARL